jgi:hypothetical protein
VKSVVRAALGALITIAASVAALLPFSGPAFATATPPAPSPALFGTWTNANPATRNVADIVITPRGGGILVDGFGACSPTPCEFGRIPGTVFAATVSNPTGNSFSANWNFGFSHFVLLATMARVGRTTTLVVREFTTFIPPDGRANFTVRERFVRARRAIIPKKSGTPAAGYPLGDSVKPVKSLLGTWKNTSPGGGSIKEIVLTLTGGVLHAHAFGNCVPALCNLGVVRAITFGTGIASVSGRVFLAPYTFSFKKDLLSGTVNLTGTILTVQSNSEFTDHSGRSNYIVTDTFRRV